MPLTLMVAVLGGLIWFAVGHALNPLQRVREEILRQDLPKLHALAINDLPEEVVPLGEALNDLLQRLESAFASERNFIADAAHELRTPLTAVRLQAQLAQRADATDQRSAALTQLLAGVDRASHLVEQLLQMARLEPDAAQFSFATLRLDRLAKDVIGEFAPGADAKEIDLGMAKSRAVEVYGRPSSRSATTGRASPLSCARASSTASSAARRAAHPAADWVWPSSNRWRDCTPGKSPSIRAPTAVLSCVSSCRQWRPIELSHRSHRVGAGRGRENPARPRASRAAVRAPALLRAAGA